MNTSTQSRVALVTGAAGGLGQAFALRLAQQGFRLVLTDRAACADLVAGLDASGTAAIDLPCDLADSAAVQHLAVDALQRAGRIDVLVNNAAFMTMAPLA